MDGVINPVEVAQEMADVVKPLGDSQLADFTYSVLQGAVDTGKDYGYLVYDFLDTDSRFQKDNDKIRLATLIKQGKVTSDNFFKILNIIYDIYHEKLTEEQKRLLARRKIGRVFGKRRLIIFY